MLHLTVLILVVCCAVSAPREGTAVIGRKNYFSDAFCLLEEEVPKVIEISSSSILNVNDERYSECVEHKITYKPSFFYNFVINQCKIRKNNHCSSMENVLKRKKKKSGSSVKLAYRKRNLLWTQKGLQSLKTLKPTHESPTAATTSTTLKSVEKHNLNIEERKRLFALKKAKTRKRTRVRRYTLGRRHGGKPGKLKERIPSGGLAGQMPKTTWDGDFREKMRPGLAFPRFRDSEKFIKFKKKRCDRADPAVQKIVQGQESAAEDTTQISCDPPSCRYIPIYVSGKRTKGVGNLNKKKHLLSSSSDDMIDFLCPRLGDRLIPGRKTKRQRSMMDRFHTQLKTLSLMKNYTSNLNQFIYDSRLEGNLEPIIENYGEMSKTTESISTNELEDTEEAQDSNKQEKNNDDSEVDRSELYPDAKAAIDLTNGKQFSTKQKMEDFLKEMLKASADYSSDENEDFVAVEESEKLKRPIKKPLSGYAFAKKEVPIVDFDFPDYDEIYDAAADFSSRDFSPLHFRKRRKFKVGRNDLLKKKYSKIREELRSDVSDNVPLDLKRSLILRKMEREKKCCGSVKAKNCRTPHRCWKSAPLLCIPYIRKGQDDLLKYLIQIMQKMMGKPYPQKIDIFENIKYKPRFKKPPLNTCDDIMPHEPEDDDDDDDDDDDSCDTNKCKSPPQACDPCPRPCPTTPESCPRPFPTPEPCPRPCPTIEPCPRPSPTPEPCPTCPPTPTPPPTSCPTTPTSCCKSCTKCSNEATCPSFPYVLPNLNQIYVESTPCCPDKCFSTLPSFLLPHSGVPDLAKFSSKPGSAPPSLTPAKSTVTSLSSTSKKDILVSSNAPKAYAPVTFSPPKKNSPDYLKKPKQLQSDSFAGNDQLQSDQRLNDKILPLLVECQEQMKLLNLTESETGTEATTSTRNEPFLFELPELYDNEKRAIDFANPIIPNSFARRDLDDLYDLKTRLSHAKNPAGVLPNAINQRFHRVHSKDRRRKKKHYYKPLLTNEDDIYGPITAVLSERDESSQIDRPLHSGRKIGKPIKHKRRKSLRRYKREDDYKVDDFVNYDGNVYNDETYGKQSLHQLKKKLVNSDVNGLADDYGWTPLKYEIFSELAKVVTETEGYETVSETAEIDLTDLTVSSVTGDELETHSVAVGPEEFSTIIKPEEMSTSANETQQCDTTLESKQTRLKDESTHISRSSSTAGIQSIDNTREEKTLNGNRDLDAAEDSQIPTTLGTAYIVKGRKKQMKPTPKMYTKVYPDSVPVESGKNDTAIVTETAPKRSTLFKTTETPAAGDVRLQLLAVCEGYLEVVKSMKQQNQSLGEDLDSDLTRYCENIISQSFSQQTESSKSKKQELLLTTTGGKENFQNTLKSVRILIPESKPFNSLRFDEPVLKRELEENRKLEAEKFNNVSAKRNETEISHWQRKSKKIKKRKKESRNGNQKVPEADDEFLKKGMTKEQMELLHVLKKRKRALLNWLFNSKESQIQPEIEETEYVDDDDESLGGSLNFRNGSGTVRPRGAEKTNTTAKVVPEMTNDSVFPVYAKQYGYDKGGELRQVEVLWRKINEKTHEKKILKNLSVLALLLTSTLTPKILNENNKFVDVNGYANEDVSETRTNNENKVGYAPEEPQNILNTSVAENATEPAKTIAHGNSTVTYISKPNPSSIIGTVLNLTNGTINGTINGSTKCPNITRRIAGKLNSAKGVVEEYTIEFWNYAVYILPIMFSILFLFCCACCGMYILKNKKKNKKKKKKKKFESTDEEESTEETDSEPKKRRDKSKKSRNVWNVWKKNAKKTSSDINEETNPPGKKKSFLRFLKKNKKSEKSEDTSLPYSALPESDEPKGDVQSEAAERRELIALLEELKKIEMENVEEKKEQKSVHVQYMIQDHDESIFKSPEMPTGYPRYSKNFPFRDPGEYGIYTDAELNELLLCGCGKKRGYFKNCNFPGNEGKCERFFKIFQNADMCHHKHGKVNKLANRDRNFTFDMSGERKEEGFTDMSSFNVPSRNLNDWVGEMEHFNHQIMKKKHVRLKDDGVLCRL